MAKKILIVDDDADILETMKEVLGKQGYETEIATNGAQALDSLSISKPDLILIDIRMPTLSGYDLLRLLRERLNHGAKMAYVTVVPKQEVDLTDVDGFIQKPFSPKEFIKKVKGVLAK